MNECVTWMLVIHKYTTLDILLQDQFNLPTKYSDTKIQEQF